MSDRDPACLRIYISGPITGQPDYNTPAFDHAERLLREAGYDVFNPRSIPAPEFEASISDLDLWRYYMRICVAEIPKCHSMYMLPNWDRSKGACWEHSIAAMLGLPIQYSV